MLAGAGEQQIEIALRRLAFGVTRAAPIGEGGDPLPVAADDLDRQAPIEAAVSAFGAIQEVARRR